MDTLRIILIVGGLALVVGIYLWDRIKSKKNDDEGRWQDIEIEGDEERIDPLINDDSPFDEEWRDQPIQAHRETVTSDESLEGLRGIVAQSADADGATDDEGNSGQEEEVIILSLMAEQGSSFNGMQLLDAMEMCGLSYGEMGIFHYTDLDSGKTLFSVANVLEPGSFDMEQIGELETPGLALFMRLPAPVDGERALLTFVQQARQLREKLSGLLTDSQRRELTRETLDELKEKARRYRVAAE